MAKNISNGVVHNVPKDLREVLTSDLKMLEKWESLTPLARNEWICWVISPTLPETRKNHIERARAELKEGKRRPCCWYGCLHRTDKKVSASVKDVVLNKQRKSASKV